MGKTKDYYARLSGISIILMAIAAGIAMEGVLGKYLQMDEFELQNKLANYAIDLPVAIISWIAILLCDLTVSWGLWKFYSSKDAGKAKLMGATRFVYSVILLIAIVQLIRSSNSENAYDLLHSFESIWQFGLIIFGIHLILLSRLVCEKRMVNRIFAILLFVAGVGYFGSNIANLFIENYELYRAKMELVFIPAMIFGEIGLAFWLLIKGKKVIPTSQQFAS